MQLFSNDEPETRGVDTCHGYRTSHAGTPGHKDLGLQVLPETELQANSQLLGSSSFSL